MAKQKLRKRFCKSLAARRSEYGWSLAELADATGGELTKAAVHGYETGRITPSLDAIESLAGALECTPGELLDGG